MLDCRLAVDDRTRGEDVFGAMLDREIRSQSWPALAESDWSFRLSKFSTGRTGEVVDLLHALELNFKFIKLIKIIEVGGWFTSYLINSKSGYWRR